MSQCSLLFSIQKSITPKYFSFKLTNQSWQCQSAYGASPDETSINISTFAIGLYMYQGKGAKKKTVKSLVFYQTGGRKLLFWGLKWLKNGQKTRQNFIFSVKKDQTGEGEGGRGIW